MARPRFLRKTFVVPAEHGSWAWWLAPFAVGAGAGSSLGLDTALLFAAVLFGFLLHQPAVIAVKARTRRRRPDDLGPALVWIGLLCVASGAAALALLLRDRGAVLAVLAPVGVLFVVQLALVARRSERRAVLVQIGGAALLSLVAPAAYAVSGGALDARAAILGLLCALAIASAVANVYLMLEQGGWALAPPPSARLRHGRTTLGLHALGLAAATGLAAVGHAPWVGTVPFLATAAEAVDTVLRPRLGIRPARAGATQMAWIAAFVAGMILAWRS